MLNWRFFSGVFGGVCAGGAERLIVDAAVELVSHGHKVHVFTSHHDKSRCFEETLSGESRFSSSFRKQIHIRAEAFL